MSLDDVIYKLKLLIIHKNITGNVTDFNSPFKIGANTSNADETSLENVYQDLKLQFENWIAQHYTSLENYSAKSKMMVILLYCLIVLVSFFGNSIVCKIVFSNSSMRSTTNIFIGNLSISDLLMTVVNVPLQLTQILSRNWPLGNFLCRCLPFFQGLSVNVSSFTMACIALDRYQVIAHPLKPRSGMTCIILKIIFIWMMAAAVSTPYPAIANVEVDLSYDSMTRCRLIYPEPQYQFRKIFTIVIFFIQYFAPLCITGVTYFKICGIIWRRKPVGVMSERQRIRRGMEKWKTIKMLIVVFLVFVICWFPLHMYHIYQDFRGPVGYTKHNSVIFLVCHWFAMSSVCYNPFLYCWLNDRFQTIAKSYWKWFLKFIPNDEKSRLDTYLKERIDKTIEMPQSKFSTFSESLNSRIISNANGLASELSETLDEFHEARQKHTPSSRRARDKRSRLNSIKESVTDADVSLEALGSLLGFKKLSRETHVKEFKYKKLVYKTFSNLFLFPFICVS